MGGALDAEQRRRRAVERRVEADDAEHLERPMTSARATVLGRYSSLRIASSTRSRVSERTCGLSCSTRETVWCETPASFATSAITAGRDRRGGVAEMAPSGGFADVLMGSMHRAAVDPLGAGFVPQRRCYRSHAHGSHRSHTRAARAAAPARRPHRSRVLGRPPAAQPRGLLPTASAGSSEAGNFDEPARRRRAAGRRFRGMVFMDSDVYKWLEALGWELGRGRRRTWRGGPTT